MRSRMGLYAKNSLIQSWMVSISALARWSVVCLQQSNTAPCETPHVYTRRLGFIDMVLGGRLYLSSMPHATTPDINHNLTIQTVW